MRPPQQPSDVPRPTDARWAVLAGVRFVLALVVVSGHLGWFTADGHRVLLANLDGTAAVLGFLVISGYSIGHSLDRRPGGFYARRLWRIYPLYAAAVAYATVPFLFGDATVNGSGVRLVPPRPTAWQVAGNLLLVQNLACPPLSSDLPVWTLAVEAWCYLAAPRLRRWPTPVLVALAAASAAMFAWYPSAAWSAHGRLHFGTLRYGLPLAMFAWAWIAGLVMYRHRRRPLRWAVATAAVGAALLTANHGFAMPYAVPTFATTAVLVAVAPRIRIRPAARAAFDYLGDLSYPLYLFHLPTLLIAQAVPALRSVPGLLATAVGVSAAALFAESTLKSTLARRADVPTRPEPASVA